MKRTVLFLMLTLSVVSLISAQGRDRKGQGQGPNSRQNEQFNNNRRQGHFRQDHQQHRHYPAPGHRAPGFDRAGPRAFSRVQTESANVSGNLTIARGAIAVENDGVTYLTFGLNRFVGFIDGLKEGAQVTLDGIAMTNPQNDKVKVLRVHKMTLNGKEYDLANSFRNSAHQTRQRQSVK